MIELIFVIVIIGILAAVAIPRLAATRDDAKIATCMDGATMFMQQVSSYYTAQGNLGKISDMTNFDIDADSRKTNGFDDDKDLGSAAAVTVNYFCDGKKVVQYDVNSSATGLAITPSNVSDSTDKDAKVAVQTATALTDKQYFKQYTLGGKSVNF
jgi:general secretion pathway protein G